MSDRDQVRGTPASQLCANGCGFFGSPATENMCSKCFKATHPSPDTPPMTAQPTPSAPPTPAPLPAAAPSAPSTPATATATAAAAIAFLATPGSVASLDSAMSTPASSTGKSKKKKKKSKKKSRKRCHHCSKRVGLTGFTCRCEGVFCDTHRYADVHSCTYDYAADHRAQLEKLNPKIVGDKFNRL